MDKSCLRTQKLTFIIIIVYKINKRGNDIYPKFGVLVVFLLITNGPLEKLITLVKMG